MQHIVETGYFGLLILLGLLTWALIKISKKQPLILVPIFMLLVHGLIDFTLSFGLSILLVALFISEGLDKEGIMPNKSMQKKRLATILVTVISIVIFVCAQRWIVAESLFKDAMDTQSIAPLEQAMNKNSFATRYILAAYELEVSHEQRIELMQKLLRIEPHHSLALFKLAESEYELKQYTKAFEHFIRSLSYDHFDRQKYVAIVDYLELVPPESEFKEQANETKAIVTEQLEFYEKAATLSTIRDQRSFLINSKSR